MNTRLSIKQAVALSGLSENYIRKAIAKGEILVTKEAINETKIEKNWIDADQFDAWRAAKKAHSKREDGRNKFVLYLNEDEEAALRAQFDNGTLVRANVKPEAVTE